MHFKTLKNKKAVSPIIATLLLILIAVAAGVIIYVWTTSYIGAQIGTVSQEPFVITKVKFYSSNKLDVTITNQGSTIIRINSAKLYESDGSTPVSGFSITSGLPDTIDPATTKTLTLTFEGTTLISGHSYVLEVTTEKGNTAVYRFTA
jgi:flagellin-like protein